MAKVKNYNYMTLYTAKEVERLKQQNERYKKAINEAKEILKSTPHTELIAPALFQVLDIDED